LPVGFLSGPADAASTFTEFFDTQLRIDKTALFVAGMTIFRESCAARTRPRTSGLRLQVGSDPDLIRL